MFFKHIITGEYIYTTEVAKFLNDDMYILVSKYEVKANNKRLYEESKVEHSLKYHFDGGKIVYDKNGESTYSIIKEGHLKDLIRCRLTYDDRFCIGEFECDRKHLGEMISDRYNCRIKNSQVFRFKGDIFNCDIDFEIYTVRIAKNLYTCYAMIPPREVLEW